jgi:2-C-methyl-D-erythritol 4-phosphate cytidylyltransferase
MGVLDTPSRDSLWAVQTPQVFRTALLQQAHSAVAEDVTDDASMVERIGGKVRVFPGSYENIKVTTPEDLVVVEATLTKGLRAGAAP